MKRTGFKRKTPSARAKIDPRRTEDLGDDIVVFSFAKAPRKRKKNRKADNISKLKEQLWELCKQVLRETQPNVCYTCGATGLSGSNWHTGHGKPKGALPLRYQYDLRNLKSQCMPCNKHHGGCSDIFIAKLEKEKDGLAFLKESCRKVDGVWIIQKNDLMGGSDAREFVKQKIEEYKQLL